MKKGAPASASREGSKEAYRQDLLEKRGQVLSAMGVKFDTLARMGRVAEDDQAQLSHDEFISLRLNSLDYGQLQLVKEALDRLDSGDFGICLACDEPIPAKRLAALPWARYCIQCQDSAGAEMDREKGAGVPRLALATR